MILGMQLRSFDASKHGNPFDTAMAVVQMCEQIGLHSVWMADHFMFEDPARPGTPVNVPDAFVMLGAFAARTRAIRLGQLVTGVPYRNPALLAKMLATLDVVSHGRSIVGLGAAWHKPEFDAYGWPFPSVKDRMEMLEEAVQIVDRMLREPSASFAGKHYTITNAHNVPAAEQRPRPPILIGGDGEKVTLKLVARYADICNVFGDAATVSHKFGVLRAHCDAVGRDFDSITRTNFVDLLLARNDEELDAKRKRFPDFAGISGTPAGVIARIAEYARAGSQGLFFSMPDADELEPLKLLGDAVLPKLSALS